MLAKVRLVSKAAEVTFKCVNKMRKVIKIKVKSGQEVLKGEIELKKRKR